MKNIAILMICCIILTTSTYSQDASGAIAGAVSTTLHISKNKKIIVSDEIKKKTIYRLDDDVKVDMTFVKYLQKEYQVFIMNNQKMYFYFKQKKIFIKKQ